MTREWRDAPGFPGYEVSSDGLIRRKAYLLKPFPLPRTGHEYVTLNNRKRMYVHRVVGLAFLDNPEGKPLVNHKNGNPKDNRAENLEWATYGENIAHGYRSNGRKHYSAVPVEALDAEGNVVATYASSSEAARALGAHKSAIRAA